MSQQSGTAKESLQNKRNKNDHKGKSRPIIEKRIDF